MAKQNTSNDLAGQGGLAIVCDDEFRRGAEAIARELSLPLLRLSEVSKGGLAHRSEVVVKANLRNI